MKKTALMPVPLLFLILLISSCGKDSPTGSDNPSNGAVKTFAITGRILESGSGLSGVSVRLAGAGKDTTAITASSGSYTFIGLHDGTYTITPSKPAYTFNPVSSTVTVKGDDKSAPDIIATRSAIPIPAEISFVSILGGTFQMGDEAGDLFNDCRPVHTVTVSDFDMGVYEITNAQYAKFLNEAMATGDITPSSTIVKGARGAYSDEKYINLAGTIFTCPDARCWITCDNLAFAVVTGHENWPVAWVTWYGAKAFSIYYGLDLPTEAEWEYACRAGRQHIYGTDDGAIGGAKANYAFGIGYIDHPVDVGSYPANPFTLRDMSGNVWEYCHDWYGEYPGGSVSNPSGPTSGGSRVVRGGSWGFGAYNCHSAARFSTVPGFSDGYGGFRVVRRVSPRQY